MDRKLGDFALFCACSVLLGAIAYYIFWIPRPSLKLPEGSYAIYSPDGKYIAITHIGLSGRSTFPGIYIRDASSGKSIAELDPGWTALKAIFSPDGKQLATISQIYIKIWDTATWQVIAQLGPTRTYICDIAYSPDGVALAVASCGPTGGSVSILDANTGEKIEELFAYGLDWARLEYSSDGNTIAISRNLEDNGVLLLWDTTKGQIRQSIDQAGDVNDFAWSPDGQLIVTVDENGMLKVWDVKEGKTVFRHKERGRLTSVAYSPNGRYVVIGGEESSASIWQTNNWKKIRSFGKEKIYSVRFSPDGTSIVITNWDERDDHTNVFEVSDVTDKNIFSRIASRLHLQ